ncbi:MAG: hypothetical protein JJLCMIEE_01864 [Acidimicrobiales bacterium]|nr:MAG: hypothetical protein EDR02_17105 [Actinomycetota bacterium]MBV6508798.1 hypothetical protein [Acidimicrobiales bacterium]RIK03662.1 MAG: hypothetical protein DCC48_16030 [Acidobacteriota bacterium]
MDHAVDLLMALFECSHAITEIGHRRNSLTVVIGVSDYQVPHAVCQSLVLGNEMADLAVLARAYRSGEPTGEDEAAVQRHGLSFEVIDELRNR